MKKSVLHCVTTFGVCTCTILKSFMWNLFLVGNSLSLNELAVVKQICNNKNVKFFPKSRRWFHQLHSCPLGLILAITFNGIVSLCPNV